MIYFVSVYIFCKNIADKNIKKLIIITFLFSTLIIFSGYIIELINILGFVRASEYYTNIEYCESNQLFLYGAIYFLPFLVIYLISKKSHLYSYIFYSNLFVFIFAISHPCSYGIYSRLLMFTMPLIAIYYLDLLVDKGNKLHIALFSATLLSTGLIRIIRDYFDGNGVGFFLAGNKALLWDYGFLSFILEK
jgi:hypothetical protein